MVLSRLRISGLLVILMTGSASALAQSGRADPYELVLRGISLAEALEVLVQETQMDLVYSSELVRGKQAFCVKRHSDHEVLLQCVLEGSGLEYVRSRSGAYVLIHSLKRPPQFGSISGAVVDEATGDPLPYANVFLAEARTGTAANAAGMFTLAPVISGPYNLTVTYVGYQTARDTVVVDSGRSSRVRVAMRAQENYLSTVVIDGLEQRLPSQGLGSETVRIGTSREVHMASSPDVMRAAAALSGVSMQRPLADLHIQGGSAGSHEVLLDGAPVREPVSLGRHLGAFSPLALGRMRIHRAGFGASVASNLTGILSVDHDVSPTGKHEIVLQADPVAFNARISGRIDIAGVRTSAMLASRTSVWDIYQAPYVSTMFRRWHEPDPLSTSLWLQQSVRTGSIQALEQSPEVRFSDIHAAAEIEPASYQKIRISLYRARNHLGSALSALNAPVDEIGRFFVTDDLYDWTNWAGSIHHNWLAGARAILSTRLSVGSHESKYSYGAAHVEWPEDGPADPLKRSLVEAGLWADAGVAPASYELHEIREATLRSDLHYSLSARSHIAGGISGTYTTSYIRLRNPFVVPFSHEINGLHTTEFLEGDLRIGYRTSIEPGIRVTQVYSRGTSYFEPRLAIRHDRENSRLGSLAVRVAGGLYRQFVNELELTGSGSTSVVPFLFFWVPTDKSLGPPRAYHAAADLLIVPSQNLTVSLSLYRKWQPRLLVLDYAALVTPEPVPRDEPSLVLAQNEFVTSARGHSTGGELRIERRNESLGVSAGYAVNLTSRTISGRFDGSNHPVPWNVPHELFGQAHVAILPPLELQTAATLSAGRRWGFRHGYYDYLLQRLGAPAFEPVDLADPGSHRLPTTFTIDIGARYELPVRTGDLQLRVLLLDALNGRHVYEHGLIGNGSDLSTTNRHLPGRSLLLSLQVRQ